METEHSSELTSLTAEIVAAYVSNNSVGGDDLGSLIGDVHAALTRARKGPSEPTPEPQEPAVSIRRSVTPDYIVCLEDGKKFKSLKRHLRTHHGLTPDEYRSKWDLKKDYPMVAPRYSESRSTLARSIGLGRKAAERRTETASAGKGTTAAAPRRAGRAKTKE
jgi:predicted transcriptional regulator